MADTAKTGQAWFGFASYYKQNAYCLLKRAKKQRLIIIAHLPTMQSNSMGPVQATFRARKNFKLVKI